MQVRSLLWEVTHVLARPWPESNAGQHGSLEWVVGSVVSVPKASGAHAWWDIDVQLSLPLCSVSPFPPHDSSY